MQTLLLAGGLTTLVAVSLYLVVARKVATRPVSEAAMPAQRAFVVWWSALGVTFLTHALHPLLLAAGIDAVGVHAALLYLRVPAFCAALWGLLTYLLYIYRGQAGYRVGLAVGYASLAALLLAFYATARPVAIAPNGADISFEWGRQLPGLLSILFLGFIVLPVFGGLIAYGTLYRRTPDRTTRRRILLVTGGLLIWFTSLVLSLGAGHTLLVRGAQIVSGLLVLSAYLGSQPRQEDE